MQQQEHPASVHQLRQQDHHDSVVSHEPVVTGVGGIDPAPAPALILPDFFAGLQDFPDPVGPLPSGDDMTLQ